MKAVTRQEIASLDREASEKYGIPSLILMENAGRAVSEAVLRCFSEARKIAVLAGKGNNAGDGFVAARYLSKIRNVTVFLFSDPEKFKGDALINFQSLRNFPVEIVEFSEDSPALNFPDISSFDLLIDAIFGTGLRGTVEEFYLRILEAINGSGVPVLAVDIPSGLDADSGKPLGEAVKAERTVTMGLPKVGLLTPSAAEFVGELEVADIGYPLKLLEREDLKGHLLEAATFKGWLPQRKRDTHKGTYGKVLLIAGSLRYRGAANLASLAALRVGAGLVELALPRSLCLKNVRKPDEVIQLPLPETDELTISSDSLDVALEAASSSKAVVLGPGLSQNPNTRDFVCQFLRRNETPTVLDADGLNACAFQPEVLLFSPAPLILTPHPGELSRLLKVRTSKIQEDRVHHCLQASRDFDSVVVLKGFRTVIGEPTGSYYINPTGNPGMASGGTGDVLAGSIGGLLAQGLALLEASCLGAYVHGLAGDLAGDELGERGIIASDLLSRLPLALRTLFD
jgi:NAD(P)H-hydrate epimerase